MIFPDYSIESRKCPFCKTHLYKDNYAICTAYRCSKSYRIDSRNIPHYEFIRYKYECAVWEKRNRIFALEVDKDQEYHLSSWSVNDWNKITIVNIEHEYRPITEIIKRLEKIIAFA